MLNEIKNLYTARADATIPSWRSISRNELFFKYCDLKDNGDPGAEDFLAAVISSFWSLADTAYYQQWVKFASEDDAYDWLIDAILYIEEMRPWNNPDSLLFGDSNAPERAITVKLQCVKTNFFIAMNRYKRRANKRASIPDEPSFDIPDPTETAFEITLKELVLGKWNKCDYITAFILDSYSRHDRFTTSTTALIDHLTLLPDPYIKEFAERYRLDISTVIIGKNDLLKEFQKNKSAYRRMIMRKLNELKDPKNKALLSALF